MNSSYLFLATSRCVCLLLYHLVIAVSYKANLVCFSFEFLHIVLIIQPIPLKRRTIIDEISIKKIECKRHKNLLC